MRPIAVASILLVATLPTQWIMTDGRAAAEETSQERGGAIEGDDPEESSRHQWMIVAQSELSGGQSPAVGLGAAAAGGPSYALLGSAISSIGSSGGGRESVGVLVAALVGKMAVGVTRIDDFHLGGQLQVRSDIYLAEKGGNNTVGTQGSVSGDLGFALAYDFAGAVLGIEMPVAKVRVSLVPPDTEEWSWRFSGGFPLEARLVLWLKLDGRRGEAPSP